MFGSGIRTEWTEFLVGKEKIKRKKVNFFLLRRLLGVRRKGTERQRKVSKLAKEEILMLNIGSMSTGARVSLFTLSHMAEDCCEAQRWGCCDARDIPTVNFFLLRRLLGVRTKGTERQGKFSKLAKGEILMLNIGSQPVLESLCLLSLTRLRTTVRLRDGAAVRLETSQPYTQASVPMDWLSLPPIMLEDMQGLLQAEDDKRQAAITDLSAKHQKFSDDYLKPSVIEYKYLYGVIAEKEFKIAEMDAASSGEVARFRAAMETVKGELIHLKV